MLHVKEATPWNATLAKLQACEERIGDFEKSALEARWEFGSLLLGRRVNYKARDVVPDDLMKLAMQQCKVGKTEITKRVQFAKQYPTRKEMSTACAHYGSWVRIKKEGLVTKPRTNTKAKKAQAQATKSLPWTLGRLNQEIDKAILHHVQLTRDQVKDLDALLVKLTTLLKQLDTNDAAKAEPKKVRAVS